MTRSWTSSLSLKTFDSCSKASTNVVLPWSTCVFYACCMLDGVKVAHCVAVGGRREPRWLDGVENARVSCLALLADAASHVCHDRDVTQTLQRRCSHPQRSAAAELPRRTSNARPAARHQRPRHAGEHRYSCNRPSHCHCCTTATLRLVALLINDDAPMGQRPSPIPANRRLCTSVQVRVPDQGASAATERR